MSEITCPRCGSPHIELDLVPITADIYLCNECGCTWDQCTPRPASQARMKGIAEGFNPDRARELLALICDIHPHDDEYSACVVGLADQLAACMDELERRPSPQAEAVDEPVAYMWEEPTGIGGSPVIRYAAIPRGYITNAVPLYTRPRLPVAVPEDWQLVPIEPTKGMLNAARDWSYGKYGKPIGNDAAIACWRVMRAAASKSETD